MQKEQKPPGAAQGSLQRYGSAELGEGQGRDARITDQHFRPWLLRVGFVFPKGRQRESKHESKQ